MILLYPIIIITFQKLTKIITIIMSIVMCALYANVFLCLCLCYVTISYDVPVHIVNNITNEILHFAIQHRYLYILRILRIWIDTMQTDYWKCGIGISNLLYNSIFYSIAHSISAVSLIANTKILITKKFFHLKENKA